MLFGCGAIWLRNTAAAPIVVLLLGVGAAKLHFADCSCAVHFATFIPELRQRTAFVLDVSPKLRQRVARFCAQGLRFSSRNCGSVLHVALSHGSARNLRGSPRPRVIPASRFWLRSAVVQTKQRFKSTSPEGCLVPEVLRPSQKPSS